MIKSSIEKLAKEIGKDIGHACDDVQADLLNGFCECLIDSMQDNNLDMQICYIVDRLSPRTKKVLGIFDEFIKLKEKEI